MSMAVARVSVGSASAVPTLLVALLACAAARIAVVDGEFHGLCLACKRKAHTVRRCTVVLLLAYTVVWMYFLGFCSTHGVRRGELRHWHLQGGAATDPDHVELHLRVRLRCRLGSDCSHPDILPLLHPYM
jgi:hypothetical protein